MDRERRRVADPAVHRPGNAELGETVSMDAGPGASAGAMANTGADALRKISDVLRPKGGNEVPVNSHVVPARIDPKPDYDAMHRIASGEPDDPKEVVERK